MTPDKAVELALGFIVPPSTVAEMAGLDELLRQTAEMIITTAWRVAYDHPELDQAASATAGQLDKKVVNAVLDAAQRLVGWGYDGDRERLTEAVVAYNRAGGPKL